MKLSDIQKRLQAPFPAHLVSWKPQAFNKDHSRVVMVAYVDARAVQDRLDGVCPNDWHFEVQPVEGLPAVRGSLTVLGVTRADMGQGNDYRTATDDALKRCAVHFGIGRYLHDLPKTWVDWDIDRSEPRVMPELPEWARPDHERTPGGSHLMQAMEQLRHELPEDGEAQKQVYRHLKAALGGLHPVKEDLS